MTEERSHRKLAAILCADVVGYSARVGHDELGARAEVRALSDEFLTPVIATHHGRLFKSLGD
jgi:class 3 adenylate cyclase